MMQFFSIEFLSPRIFSAETTMRRCSPARINSINSRWRRVVYSVNYTFMAACITHKKRIRQHVKSALTAIFRA